MKLHDLLHERVGINILSRIYPWNENKTLRIDSIETITSIEEKSNYIFSELNSFLLLYESKLIQIKGRSREYNKEEIVSILKENYSYLTKKEFQNIKELFKISITSKGKEFVRVFDKLIYCFNESKAITQEKNLIKQEEKELKSKKGSKINQDIIDKFKSQLNIAEQLQVIKKEDSQNNINSKNSQKSKKTIPKNQIIIEYVLTNLEQKILVTIYKYYEYENHDEEITPKKIVQIIYPFEPYKKKSPIISHYLKNLEELHLIKRHKEHNKTNIKITATGKRTVVEQELEKIAL